jgi:hypothetical protein
MPICRACVPSVIVALSLNWYVFVYRPCGRKLISGSLSVSGSVPVWPAYLSVGIALAVTSNLTGARLAPTRTSFCSRDVTSQRHDPT